MEVRGDLPAVLDVEQWQGDIKRLNLYKEEELKKGFFLPINQ